MARSGSKASRLQEGENAATKGERSQRLIKRAIATLATQREVGDIALADICAAVNLTTGAVYFHFANKDDAVEAMVIDEVGDLYRECVEAVPAGADLRQVLDSLLRVTTEFHRVRKRLAKAIQLVINTRPSAYQAWIAARKPFLQILEQAIREARQQQGVPPTAAPFLALMILGAIEDLSMDAFQWGNPSLTPHAKDLKMWRSRQVDLWAWAALAPVK